MNLIDEIFDGVMGTIFEIIDGVYDLRRGGGVRDQCNSYITQTFNRASNIILEETTNAVNKMSNVVVEELVPNIVDRLVPAVLENTNDTNEEELSEYESFEGDGSDFITERLELDSNYPMIKLSDSNDENNNIFGSALFRFRTQGPRYGSDIRLEPYYRIPMKFYENKWGEEIIIFTDVLAGYVGLIEQIRSVSGDPTLMFGVNMYHDPDAFMLGSLDKNGKMDSNVFITVKDGKYEVVWKRDLGWKIISGQTDY